MRDLSLRLILRFITDQFTAALNAARAQLGDFSGNARTSDAAVGGFQQRVNRAVRSVLDLGGAVRGLIAGFSLLALAAGIKELIQFADTLRLVEGRIKNASTGTVDFVRNYAQLVLISFKTGTAFAENANMFARINAGIQAIGGSSKDSLRQVDLLAKSMGISNTAQSESTSVIRQWSQAMASGLLRGDEFNSIMENSPRIAKAIADGLRVNIGVLRAMAEAGELTAAKVSQALASQGQAIDEEFKKIPLSIGRAWEMVKTGFGQYIADADRGQGATAGLASGIELLAQNIKPLLDTLVTLAKITAIVFAGSAITTVSAYLAAQYRVLTASRALAAMTVAHSEALRMDLQHTVQVTAARVAEVQADIAATQARLAGTLSMGERMAATNALNLQTQALTAATLAQTEANAALAASTVTVGARLMALLNPMNLLNLAMAGMAGYMVGEWLNSFSVVRKGAGIAIDAILSALAELEYQLKSTGLQWQLVFTWDEDKRQALKTALADLDAQFIEGAKAREMAKNGLLAEEDATGKAATGTDKLIDSFKSAKTPQQTFIEKSRELTHEFNSQKKAADGSTMSLDTYTKALLSLHNAMQTDVAKQQTPFEKERADLQDKADQASLSPEAYQRQQYLTKGFSQGEADELMVLWRQTETAQKGLAQTSKALTKETLDAQLAAIKTRQDGLKSTHDLELKQLESNFKAQELSLKQQGLSELEQQAQSIVLAKELAAAKLTIQRDFIVQSAALERAAIEAKIQAAQAEAPVSSMAPLYQRAEEKYNLPTGLVRSVAQVESGHNKDAVSPAGAAGLMQLMPETAKSLGVKDVFNPEQNIEGGAKLLRELLDTFNGDVKLALMAYNSTPEKVKNAGGDLNKMKPETQAYVPNVLGEMQNPTPMSGSATEEDKQALTVKLAALNAELVANEANTQAQLQSLGIDAQNAVVEQSAAELAYKKATLEQQKQLNAENAEATHNAALDALSAKEAAVQQELDLGAISNEQHLANLRGFAAERLAIELDLLDAKRKLLADDKLALAQNLHEKEALVRRYVADQKNLDNQEALGKKEHFKQLFQPFEHALEQMTNGVLTGQQTIKNAVRNAAQSIVVSYAASFIKTRVLSTAQWAWEVSGFAGKEAKEKAIKNASVLWDGVLWAKKKVLLGAQWAWEVMGFGAKEATNTTTKIVNEGVQTGAQMAGDAARVTSTVAADSVKKASSADTTEQSIVNSAISAAGGAYDAMVGIPYVGPIIAPIAAAVAFTSVMLFGNSIMSARGGEWQVAEDGVPYVLHENESVLPAGVAENFRKVTNIVKGHVGLAQDDATRKKLDLPADSVALVNQLLASGQIPKQLSLPDHALNLASQSKAAAEALAGQRVKADNEQKIALTKEQSADSPPADQKPFVFSPTYHVHAIDTRNAERFFKEHGAVMVKQLSSMNRRFVKS